MHSCEVQVFSIWIPLVEGMALWVAACALATMGLSVVAGRFGWLRAALLLVLIASLLHVGARVLPT
jgi:hypothetical protein